MVDTKFIVELKVVIQGYNNYFSKAFIKIIILVRVIRLIRLVRLIRLIRLIKQVKAKQVLGRLMMVKLLTVGLIIS